MKSVESFDSEHQLQKDQALFGHQRYFHSDLKLENVVISDGYLKLIDFQSLATESLSPWYETAAIHQTVSYQHRIPSAVRCDASVHEAAEVWALGVMLFKLLTYKEVDNMIAGEGWIHSCCGLELDKLRKKFLPPDHLLQQDGPETAANLLELIFNPNETPTLKAVAAHPWIANATQAELQAGSKKILMPKCQKSFQNHAFSLNFVIILIFLRRPKFKNFVLGHRQVRQTSMENTSRRAAEVAWIPMPSEVEEKFGERNFRVLSEMRHFKKILHRIWSLDS